MGRSAGPYASRRKWARYPRPAPSSTYTARRYRRAGGHAVGTVSGTTARPAATMCDTMLACCSACRLLNGATRPPPPCAARAHAASWTRMASSQGGVEMGSGAGASGAMPAARHASIARRASRRARRRGAWSRAAVRGGVRGVRARVLGVVLAGVDVEGEVRLRLLLHLVQAGGAPAQVLREVRHAGLAVLALDARAVVAVARVVAAQRRAGLGEHPAPTLLLRDEEDATAGRTRRRGRRRRRTHRVGGGRRSAADQLRQIAMTRPCGTKVRRQRAFLGARDGRVRG